MWFRNKNKKTRPAASQGTKRSSVRSKLRLLLEKLEDRTVPAGSLVFTTPTLTFTAGATDTNDLTISFSANTFTFTDTNAIVAGAGCTQNGPDSAQCSIITNPTLTMVVANMSNHAGDIVDLQSDEGSTTTTINNGTGGSATINVSSTAPTTNTNGTLSGNLSGIAGELAINTQGGGNTLNVSDYSAAAGDDTYTLSQAAGPGATTLTSSDATGNIVYDANGTPFQLQNFNLTGSAKGGNTYNIDNTTATTTTTIGDGDASATTKAGSTFNIDGDNLGAGNDFKGFGGGNRFFLNITANLGNNTAAGGSFGTNPLTSLTIEGDGGGANPGSDTTRNQLIVNDLSGTARALNFHYTDPTKALGNLDIEPVPLASSNGLGGSSASGLVVHVLTTQTLIFNNNGSGAIDNDTITGTTASDTLTVAQLPTTTPIGSGSGTQTDDPTLLPDGTVAGASVTAFLDGAPYFNSPPVALINPANLPGVAGGGSGPDLLLNGLNNDVFNPGLTLDGGTGLGGGSAASGNGDRAVIYAASEGDLVDTGNATDIFGLGAGVLQKGFGLHNAWDDGSFFNSHTFTEQNGIYVSDSAVFDSDLIGGVSTFLVPINLDTSTFVQNTPAVAAQQAALTVDGGDEAAAQGPTDPDPGVSDNFNVIPSNSFNIQVNGNLPTLTTVNGVPQGDQLNLTFTGSINVFSDAATPPNVTITGQTANGGSTFGVSYSSIERLNMTPGNGVVNIIGDNDVAGGDQNDYFKIRGGIDPFGMPVVVPPDGGQLVDPPFTNGMNQFTLQIGGSWHPADGAVGNPDSGMSSQNDGLSSKIYFFGVVRINASGGAATGFDTNGNAIPDTTDPAGVNALDLIPYADNTPLGWGIATFWNQGNPFTGLGSGTTISSDGGLENTGADLMIIGGVPGVSENLTIQPSAYQAGQLIAINEATGTPINVVNYTNNTNIIVNGDTGTTGITGSAGDLDNLFLLGTDPANPGQVPATSGNDNFVADFTAAGGPGTEKVKVTDAANGNPLYNLQTFSNFNTINVNMLGGSDLFNLVNGQVGGGLTLNVDGGPPSGTAGPVNVDTIQVDVPTGGLNEFEVSPGASNDSGQINVSNTTNGAVGFINFTNTEAINLIGGGSTGIDLVTFAGTQGDDTFQLTGTEPDAGRLRLNSGPLVTFSNMAMTAPGSGDLTEIFLLGNGGNDSYTITQVGGWNIDDVVVEGNGSDSVTLLGTTAIRGDAYTYTPIDPTDGTVVDNDGITTTTYPLMGVSDLTIDGQTTVTNTLAVDVPIGESYFITPGQDSGSGTFTVNNGLPGSTPPGINLLPVNYLHMSTVTPTTGSVADVIAAAGDSVNVSAGGIVTVTDASGIIQNTYDFSGDPDIQLDIDALAGHVAVTINENTTAGSLFGGGIQVLGGNGSTNGDSVTVVSSTAANTTAYDFLLNMLTGIVTGPISLFGIASLFMDGTAVGTFVLTNYGVPTNLTQVTINATGSSSVTINGATGKNSFTYSPTAATAGTVSLADPAPVVNFSGVGGTFTLDPGAGGTNQVTVNGTAGDDTITVVNGAIATADTQVTVNALEPVEIVTADTASLMVDGGTGNDVLEVFSTFLPVTIPITYDGGPGTNALFLTSGGPAGLAATSDTYTPGSQLGSGTNTLVFTGAAAGTEVVHFLNLAPVFDLVPGPLVVNGTNAANSINYKEGFSNLANFIAGTPSPTWGEVSVDGFEPEEFINKTTLTINGLAGDDTFNLNNPNTPTALTSITVNGEDPTAGDTLIANGTAGADSINFAPTGPGAGSITGAGPVPITFATIGQVTINGQGGNDTLTVTTPAGANKDTYTPGTAPDAGVVHVDSLVPLTFQNLGAAGTLAIANAGGTRVDTLTVNGTIGNDTFNVAATTGAVTLNAQIPITTAGVTNLVLNGLGGQDVFNLNGTLPYVMTTVEADQTTNLTGNTGPVTVNMADNTPGSANPNTTITGYGGTVVLVGVATANLTLNNATPANNALTVNGYAGPNTYSYTPTGATAGTFSDAGVATTFNFTGVAATAAFTINGNANAGVNNQVTVFGSPAGDTIGIVKGASTTVQVNALQTVTLPTTTVQNITVASGGGVDTFNVSGTNTTQVLNVQGGAPTANNPLGSDTLNVTMATTANATTVTPGSTPDAGSVNSVQDGNVGFTGIASVTVTGVAGGANTLTALGTNGNDAIALQHLGTTDRIWVNNRAVITFANYPTVTLNGLFGNDTYAVSPVGLSAVVTAINVTGQPTPNSDTLVVNGTSAAETITYKVGTTPTSAVATPGNGTVTVGAGAPVAFTAITGLTINGQGGNDTLTVTTPTGANQDTYTPGTTPDAGVVQVDSLTPLTFQNLGTTGTLAFTNTGGTRVDTLTVTGTTGNDTFNVAATTGTVTLNAQIPITTAGVANLVLNGLTGLDVFNVTGALPYTTTTLSGDATANLAGATGPVTVNIADNTLPPPADNTTITGYGGTVVLVGTDIANLNTNGNTLTANGYSGPNTYSYTPTGASAGTFSDPAVSTPGITTDVGVNTVFNFFNLSAAAGAFTLNGGANLGDQVVVQGPNTPSFIVVNSTTRTVTVQNAAGTTLQPVTLGANVEEVTVNGNLGSGTTFLVIPAPATTLDPALPGGGGIAAGFGPGGSGTEIPLNLLVNIVGGPANNDALVIASTAAGAALPNTDFVVDLLSLTPGTGTIRDFRTAAAVITALPDITYSNIGTVAPLVTPNGTDPNLLNLGPDNLEPNNSLANASFLGTVGSAAPLNEPHLALFPNALQYKFVPADQDWFRVEAQATGTLDFQVFFQTYAGLPANGVLDMNVLDANGNVIAGFGTDTNSTTGANDRRRIPVVAGQTYYVEILGANPNVVNGYSMSIIDTPAPTPFDLQLSRSVPNGESGTAAGAPDTGDLPPNAAADDTGRSQFDNVTNISTPTIYIQLNDGNLLNDLPGNGTPGTPLGLPAIPIPFQTTVTPGYRVAIFDGTNSQTPVGFATQVAPVGGQTFPGLYQFTFTTKLADGVHNIYAAVQMIDPTNVATGGELTGFGTFSTTALQLTIDTVPPPVEFGDPQTNFNGLVSQSDSGSAVLPATLNDLITNVTNPTFFGLAEANSIVTLYDDIDGSGVVDANSVYLGQAQAIPIDGTNAFPNGQWTITSVVNLNNPSFFPLDGVRNLLVVAQDLAGNNSTPSTTSKESIFIQTQGPTVTSVAITNAPAFNLLASKANELGNGTQLTPTPPVNGITLTFQSLPNRSALFLNDVALLAQAIIIPSTLMNPSPGVFEGAPVPGTFILTGENVGNIPITNIIVTENPVVAGLPATATVQLQFPAAFTPLPDDQYTLQVTGNVIDLAGNPLLGGLFTTTFIVNSHPNIGTWWSGNAYLDVNGDGVFDPQGEAGNAATNKDLVFSFGLDSDYLFDGNFAPPNGVADTTFDKIGAYGEVNGVFRFLLDFTGGGATPAPGTPGYIVPIWQIDGIPIAGHFDPALPNSEQIGVFDGHGNWYLNSSGSDVLGSAGDTIVSDGLTGYPVVGDFDGSGNTDLATYQPSTETWTFDLDNPAIPGNTGPESIVTMHWGFPGVGARPVAADMNLDGVTDIGLMVPGSEGSTPEITDDWYFLVSQGTPIKGTINTLNHAFSPTPLGNDLFFQFGNSQALPLVGTFDPPSTINDPPASAATAPTANWWAGLSGPTAMTNVSEPTLSAAVGWQDVMAVDLNGDGKTDIVGMTTTGQWWVALSTGDGFDTQLWTTWYAGAGWTNIHTGVFTANGQQDIIGMTASGQWWLAINEGTGFVNVPYGQWYAGAGWQDVVVGDFNGDGKDDIAGLTAAGQWWVGMNNGTQFVNQLGTTWYAGAGWRDIQVGDFTGDGKDDILGRTSSGQWWLAISNGQTFANVLYGQWYEAAGWQDVMVGDFNHDGRLDVIGMTNSGQWWLAENTGTGFVNKLWGGWSSTAGWQDVMEGDFNGDGYPDIVGRTAGGQWWLAVDTASGFINVPWGQWSSAVNWQNVLAGDFNGDGKTDVIGLVS